MTPFEAVILGIIQGLTEFIPISSTAHLKVIPVLLGWKEPGAAFTAVIQIGTWVASVIYFWGDIVRLTRGFVLGLYQRKPLLTAESRLAWLIIVGTIPIVLAGLLLEKHIKGPLRSLYVIAFAAIGFAILLLAAEWFMRRRREPGKGLYQVDLVETLAVGLAQTLALIPGASRSGVTITAGLFAGLSRETAARFSFLLSLPAVLGAGLYQLYKERDTLLSGQEAVINLAIATVVSGVVGYASIAFLLGYLRRNTTMVFIVYRIALGLTLFALLYRGVLQP